MEANVVDVLKKVGYPDVSEKLVKESIKDGPKSIEYTKIVEWLSKELCGFCNLDGSISAITSQEDSSSFLLEVSSFLKEIGCQYKSLTEGHVNQRLQSVADRLLLLDYLTTELFAAKIVSAKKPASNDMLITLDESSTAKDLDNILSTLNIPVSNDVDPEKLFCDIQTKVEEILNKAPKDLLSEPLFKDEASSEQWESVSKLHSELQDEYKTRREMLLKRLDVTVQSFMWSERMVGQEEKIASIYYPKRQSLKPEPSVGLADILAARVDLAVIEKTSCMNVRKKTQSSVNKVVIGRVPDRGGRPSEQQPPPPEMPSWTQRSSGGGFGRGGRGGRGGGGRGGGSGPSHHQGGKWNRDRGGHGDRNDRKRDLDDRHKSKYNDDRGYFISEKERFSRR